MVQRGRETTLEERIEIGERWKARQTDPEIAAAMGRPVPTVRKWRRKHQREGRSGLVSHMGRPATGALGQFALEIREAVREMRERCPGWGPVTIRTELGDDRRFDGMKLPDRSRIAAFLKQENLTRKYERHSELPQPQAAEPERAHEQWEMDAQGVVKVPDLGSVSISLPYKTSVLCLGIMKNVGFLCHKVNQCPKIAWQPTQQDDYWPVQGDKL